MVKLVVMLLNTPRLICCNYSYSYLLFSGNISGAFLSSLNEAKLGDQDAYMELNLNDKDFVDGAWMLRMDKTGEPFILFMECKYPVLNSVASGIERKGIPFKRGLSEEQLMQLLPGNGQQAQRMLEVEKAVKQMASVEHGSAADAIRKGNYLFVYLSTGASPTFGVGEHILRLGDEDSNRFLICFRDLCRMHRMVSEGAKRERSNNR